MEKKCGKVEKEIKFVEIFPEQREKIVQIKEIEEKSFGKGAIDEWVLMPIVRYGKIFGLESCGKVIGVLELMQKWGNNEAYIFSLAILDEFKGKGYGNYLLKNTIEELKKYKINKLSLTVSEKNIIAINLYKKFGFKEIKMLKDEYGIGIDRIYMRKD
ncbi:GNAT family N-acetyltransferase [Haliovirga abyssi]|uniref:N-acetyltransferase n=1 Tax=Haliovirga abyssi TaxID=2996794 RepID=A0AAU9DGG6_9FUSO|nr:N-acetyltransferase [Haliovirga abyssi]BDU51353.1 N-acetyltransferase [Haliovirga abyssi]